MNFRNTQERKWAKFFDLVGIKYIHNPPKVEITCDYCYSPSFYLPEVDTSFMEKFKCNEGVYFDVIQEDDEVNSYSVEFPEPLVTGYLLPVSSDEDPYSLRHEQLIDGYFTFMTMFDSVTIAEPHYHSMKQERWIEQEQYYEKDRMMIPFFEAQEAEQSFS